MYKNSLLFLLLCCVAIIAQAQPSNTNPASRPRPVGRPPHSAADVPPRKVTATPVPKKVSPPTVKAKSKLKIIEVSYTCDSMVMKGYVAYDSTIKGKMPAVLVLPEWWGYGEYTKMRARMLAEMGFIAMAVDLYGRGREAKDVAEAQALSEPFYKDANMALQRAMAAERHIRSYKMVDQNNIGIIGYCFGGAMALNYAKQGMNIKAVVSFHGGLKGVPPVRGGSVAKILVCHGGADKFVSDEEVAKFKTEMDNAGIPYFFRSYPNATHAFTNPNATAIGKKFDLPIAYNEEADKRSWKDMQTFLHDAFMSRGGSGAGK